MSFSDRDLYEYDPEEARREREEEREERRRARAGDAFFESWRSGKGDPDRAWDREMDRDD